MLICDQTIMAVTIRSGSTAASRTPSAPVSPTPRPTAASANRRQPDGELVGHAGEPISATTRQSELSTMRRGAKLPAAAPSPRREWPPRRARSPATAMRCGPSQTTRRCSGRPINTTATADRQTSARNAANEPLMRPIAPSAGPMSPPTGQAAKMRAHAQVFLSWPALNVPNVTPIHSAPEPRPITARAGRSRATLGRRQSRHSRWRVTPGRWRWPSHMTAD
jgi:hypothetical protein